jgi:hypothetical protein
MSDDEIDFSEAKPTTAQKTVEFFKEPIKPPLPGPESVDDLAETPLAYTEICEPLLKELHGCVEKRKHFAEYETQLKDEVRKLLGKDLGMIQRGAYGVDAKETSTPSRTDWVGALVMIKAFVEDQIGKEGRAQIEKIIAQNTTPGGKTVKLVPYRVGSEPRDE